MTGRKLRMKRNLFWQALRRGPALDEEIANRRVREEIHRLPRIEHIRKIAGRRAALWVAEARRAWPCAGDGAWSAARPADGRHEPRGKGGHEPFHRRGQPLPRATIALIEHDIGVVMDLSDRVVVLAILRPRSLMTFPKSQIGREGDQRADLASVTGRPWNLLRALFVYSFADAALAALIFGADDLGGPRRRSLIR